MIDLKSPRVAVDREVRTAGIMVPADIHGGSEVEGSSGRFSPVRPWNRGNGKPESELLPAAEMLSTHKPAVECGPDCCAAAGSCRVYQR